MKKFLAILLVMAMTLCFFTGCGGKDNTTDDVADNTAGDTANTDAGAADDTADDAADDLGFETVEAGILKVAISPDFAPMEFVDISKTGQDQYVGFDVSLAKFIASELGLELEICPMSFDSCQVAVQTGSVDMSISGYSVTDERKMHFNLSDYYYAGDNETEQVIIVPADKAGTFSTAADFDGLKVGAQAASLQYDLVVSQLTGAEAVVFTDINTGIMQLEKGDFDAMAVAFGNAEAIMASNDNVALSGFQFEVDAEQENNVILLPKDADAMTEAVNEVLAKAYDAGYYGEWYDEATALAEMDTAEEVSIEDGDNA